MGGHFLNLNQRPVDGVLHFLVVGEVVTEGLRLRGQVDLGEIGEEVGEPVMFLVFRIGTRVIAVSARHPG